MKGLDATAHIGSLGVTASGFLSSEREINLSYLKHDIFFICSFSVTTD